MAGRHFAPGDPAPDSRSAAPSAAGSGGLRTRRRLRGVTPVAQESLQIDTLAPFAQAILVIRWGTTVVSLLLASPELRDGDGFLIVASAALLAYTLFRTVRPLRYRDDLSSLLVVLAEVGSHAPRPRGHRLLGVATRLLGADCGRGGGVRSRVRLRAPHRRRHDRWRWACRGRCSPPSPRTTPERPCSGRSRSCSWPSSPAMPAASRARPTNDRSWRSIVWVACRTPTPCSTSCTRSRRRCPPPSTSTRSSTRRWISCGSSSTSTPSRCWSWTTPTSSGTPCAARARALRPSSPRTISRRPWPARCGFAAWSASRTSSPRGPRHLPELGLRSLRRATRTRLDHRPAVDRARRLAPLHVAGRRPPGRVRGTGGARHRQRPLVQSPSDRRSRRGAHPDRPRPPRSHRPVPRVPRLRARPHRQERGDRRRQRDRLGQPADGRARRDPRGARHAL